MGVSTWKVSAHGMHVTCLGVKPSGVNSLLAWFKMQSSLQLKIRDISVVRRIGFAATFFPRSMPAYWESVTRFGVLHRQARSDLTPEQVRLLVENLDVLDKEAFTSDEDLLHEIVDMPRPAGDGPLGIVLISAKETCTLCGSKLNMRVDRPSRVTLYDDHLGAFQATHFTKYCRKQGCSHQQYYGFSTNGDSSEVTYDPDWQSLPYFLSSQETGFAVDMLRRLDSEILLGQISYKQRAAIFNDIHWYVVHV